MMQMTINLYAQPSPSMQFESEEIVSDDFGQVVSDDFGVVATDDSGN